MPAKNSLKDYSKNSYYHIYNRGVEKRLIFQDKQDYVVFLSYLQTYLVPKNEDLLTQQLSDPSLNSKEKDKILNLLKLNNFTDEITLLAYCLMPNHFHFLLKQKSADSDEQLLNVSHYIHKNPIKDHPGLRTEGVPLRAYFSQPSSYPEYLGQRKTEWIHPEEILFYFSTSRSNNSYQKFIEETDNLPLVESN